MAALRRRQGSIGYWAAVLAMAAFMAGMIVTVMTLAERVDAAERELAASEQDDAQAIAQRQALADSIDALRAQVESLGADPVSPPPEDIADIPEPELIEGPAGRAPTAAEVRNAVRVVLDENPNLTRPQVITAVTEYLTANPPADGVDGDDGEPGRPPTADEIGVAVAAYCAGDACKGETGSTGGTGPAGPGPTDEQIASAVAAYCDARGACIGRPGANGDDGEPPFSWTYVRGGKVYQCNRVEGFDPATPIYECPSDEILP